MYEVINLHVSWLLNLQIPLAESLTSTWIRLHLSLAYHSFAGAFFSMYGKLAPSSIHLHVFQNTLFHLLLFQWVSYICISICMLLHIKQRERRVLLRINKGASAHPQRSKEVHYQFLLVSFFYLYDKKLFEENRWKPKHNLYHTPSFLLGI